MKLELIKMPKRWEGDKGLRRCVIVINDIIIDDIIEDLYECRQHYDERVNSKIALLEEALGVMAKRYRTRADDF